MKKRHTNPKKYMMPIIAMLLAVAMMPLFVVNTMATEPAGSESEQLFNNNTVQETAVEEPVVEELVAEEPAAEAPSVEESEAEETASEVEAPVAEELAAEAAPVNAPDAAAKQPAEDLAAQAAPAHEDQAVQNDAANEQLPEEKVVWVWAKENADVRLDPNGMSKILLTVQKNAKLQLLSVDGDWAKIKVSDKIGWILKSSLSGLQEEEKVYTFKKVTIFTSLRMQMTPGETIYLTSALEGFEDCEVVLFQWECDQGNGFEPVPGANSDHYEFPASVESLSWSWQLNVSFR